MATHFSRGIIGSAAVTTEIQAMVQSLKLEVAERLNRSLLIYRAVSYRSQQVAGTNYFIKVLVREGDDYIHLRVFQPVPHVGGKPSLVDIPTDKKLFDENEYF